MSKYAAENWTVEVMDWDDKCRARYTMNFREHDAGRKRLLESAPALLEALESLLLSIDASDLPNWHFCRDRRKARAAIAAAKGDA